MKTITVINSLGKNNNFSSHDNNTYNTLHCIFRHKGYIIYNYICTYLQNLIFIVSKLVTSMTL